MILINYQFYTKEEMLENGANENEHCIVGGKDIYKFENNQWIFLYEDRDEI